MCESVNQLVEEGYMTIDGKKVNLHFHFGGDYKVSEQTIDMVCKIGKVVQFLTLVKKS